MWLETADGKSTPILSDGTHFHAWHKSVANALRLLFISQKGFELVDPQANVEGAEQQLV